MSRTAWFHCPSGVAGDMALGALLDADRDGVAGVHDAVAAALGSLPAPGLALRAEQVLRGGIASTLVNVLADGPAAGDPPHRGLADVLAVVHGAAPPLPARVAARAVAVFTLLAEVEARLHGVGVDEVHFHEVGALDAIADVVGTCAALEALRVDVVACGPVAVGTGTVRAAHGTLPNPAPAVVDLLARRAVPTVGVDVTVELATPTGVALLVALAATFGPLPALAVEAVGYGAGSRDRPGAVNAVQVVIGTPAPAAGAAPAATPIAGPPGCAVERLVVLEANVDDATGEVLGHAVARLLAEGALDAWLVPTTGKKGRPAHVVGALARPDDVAAIGARLLAETGSLGVRATAVDRFAVPRDDVTVEVGGLAVRVKRSPHRVKAEADDAVAAAAALGLPLREVQRLAEAQAQRTT